MTEQKVWGLSSAWGLPAEGGPGRLSVVPAALPPAPEVDTVPEHGLVPPEIPTADMLRLADTSTATDVSPTGDTDRGRDTAPDVQKRDTRAETPEGKRHRSGVPQWPLWLLATPAGVATWSGWVGLGQMTGFGKIHPLPGIWGGLTVDTAITLPIGVEAYAAYALGAFLSARPLTRGTRRFSGWSALASLLLGMAGQVAYHLLRVGGSTHAPTGVVILVSCLPVLVLGMGATLAHLLHRDARETDTATGPVSPVADMSVTEDTAKPTDTPADVRATDTPPTDTDVSKRSVPSADTDISEVSVPSDTVRPARPPRRTRTGLDTGKRPSKDTGRPVSKDKLAEAREVAERLSADGIEVTRKTLRTAGVRGSNSQLQTLASRIRAERAEPVMAGESS